MSIINPPSSGMNFIEPVLQPQEPTTTPWLRAELEKIETFMRNDKTVPEYDFYGHSAFFQIIMLHDKIQEAHKHFKDFESKEHERLLKSQYPSA